jgi:phosphoribosylamine--glycine ligase
MRFLGVGDACELGALYMRLQEEGHDVRVFIQDPLCRGTLAGIVPRSEDWRRDLSWVGKNGIILFENVAEMRGALQDDLRKEGYRIIGGSAFGDRLENQRFFAQRVLADLGVGVCPMHEFSDHQQGIKFIAEHPGRYVLKFNGYVPSFKNYVGKFADGHDVAAILARLPPALARHSFVLMEYVDGIEMGVGAYFNGECFLTPACLDWEHKRFFPHDLGELTPEMGTVVTYARTSHFFDLTLRKMEPLLKRNGYCGYININTIVNERGIWPLEFTCRFGYPGFAILDSLQRIGWGDLFLSMIEKSGTSFDTAPGFAVGLVLTTPPFPYERSQVDELVGLPVLFDDDMTLEERRHLHYGEVGMQDGKLITSGVAGWTMVVTGQGATIKTAQRNATKLADKVFAPNVRYRQDIGDRLIDGNFAKLERLGIFGDQSGPVKKARKLPSRSRFTEKPSPTVAVRRATGSQRLNGK